MNNNSIKQIIAVSASIFILAVAYFGTYLPMRKSMIFINNMQSFGGVKSVYDFEQLLSIPLDYPSPIGQEELVRSTANTINGSLHNVSDPRIVDELIKYAESYYGPIIARGRGMSFGQNVYLLGVLNESAFLKTNNPKYLQAAENYYKEEQALGPKRPQGLYGLLDVYRMDGKLGEFKAVADQVMSQWPTDIRSKSLIDQVFKQVSSVPQK